MTGRAATVILPTTGDRGPLLRHSVASVLAQTVTDLELFIVGDGMSPATREVAEDLAAADDRVHVIDRPKHPRRGEPYRHQVLTEEAVGRVIAYLCDRDLWLPTHLAELTGLLDDGADIAHTLRFDVDRRRRLPVPTHQRPRRPADRSAHATFPSLLPLSFVGHTLDAYRRLPHGWRTTPEHTATDRYMWAQFLDQPWVTVASSPMPTVLYFKRGDHPGWSPEERLALLEAWTPQISSADAAADVQRQVLGALWQRGPDSSSASSAVEPSPGIGYREPCADASEIAERSELDAAFRHDGGRDRPGETQFGIVPAAAFVVVELVAGVRLRDRLQVHHGGFGDPSVDDSSRERKPARLGTGEADQLTDAAGGRCRAQIVEADPQRARDHRQELIVAGMEVHPA